MPATYIVVTHLFNAIVLVVLVAELLGDHVKHIKVQLVIPRKQG